MGFLDRLANIVRSKTNKAMDKLEDPRDSMDYAYEHYVEALHKLDQSLTDVTTSRTRLEMQQSDLSERIDQLEEQAKRATEKRARVLVARKLALQSELHSLDPIITDIKEREDVLAESRSSLQIKVYSLDMKRHALRAQYTAAEAQAAYDEQAAGISTDIINVDDVIRKSNDKTLEAEARSAAIKDLVDRGVFDTGTGRPTEQAIDDEMKRLRGA